MVMLSQFNGAVMDSDRRHRFLLWRFWDERPRMLFIGLNPSTANELTDDPTVRRLSNFAQKWGYGGLYACNLYSYVTPYPKELLPEVSLHAANRPAIQMALKLAVLVVCGWGDGIEKVSHGKLHVQTVCEWLEAPMCFGLTASGNPRHPLYLNEETELVDFQCVRKFLSS